MGNVANWKSLQAPQPGDDPLGPTPAPRRVLSPEQKAVVLAAEEKRSNIFVEALAGTGKTTLLTAVCGRIRGNVALAAYNKKIADEITAKTSHMDHVRVGTFHSFGMKAWKRAAPHAKIDALGKFRMMREAVGVPFSLGIAVGKLVSVAKQSAVGELWQEDDLATWERLVLHYGISVFAREGDGGQRNSDHVTSELIEYARKGIAWSREVGKTLIDFDDMLWLPIVEDVEVWRNDWVLVDEAQDTNAVRRLLAAKMTRTMGRMIWVGDRNQAIYGFTGADNDAVDKIIGDFRCRTMPLTVTFRCSKAATLFAQTWVPEIRAHEDNAEGSVTSVDPDEFYADVVPTLRPGDAILCRYTRPLVTLAFQLIKSGIGCHVEGRDIGKQLESLAGKWDVTSAAALGKMLEVYRASESRKYVERDAGHLLDSLNDRIDTVLAIMDGCDTVEEVKGKIARLFQDEQGRPRTVMLSTVHKAKGREWDRVLILGFGQYMPSPRAKQQWEQEQEKNLIYVAVTRAKRDLVLVDALDEPGR